jgi:hypothetical protein
MQQFPYWEYTWKTEEGLEEEFSHPHVQSNIIHNSQKVEKYLSVCCWMNG